MAERSVRNAKTGEYFGFMDWFSGGPAIYRSDVWAPTGLKPSTWADVLRAAPALKAAGHPIGIGMAPEGDAQITLCSLLFCYGGSIQDEAGNVTIGRPATVEAVKVGAEIYRKGMNPEVLEWKDPVSDNRALLSGQARADRRGRSRERRSTPPWCGNSPSSANWPSSSWSTM